MDGRRFAQAYLISSTTTWVRVKKEACPACRN